MPVHLFRLSKRTFGGRQNAGSPSAVPIEVLTGSVTTGASVVTSLGGIAGSWTPAPNDLILVSVAMRATGITPTCAGNGLNFVVVQDVTNAQSQNRLVVFRAMGPAPTPGAITVTITGNVNPCGVIASRFGNADTSGTDGSGAVETSATNAGPPVTDDDDMLQAITTVSPWALAWGAGTYRSGTFTVPGGQNAILTNLVPGGAGGAEANSSQWYVGPVVVPAATTVGALNDLNTVRDWTMVVVSIKGGGSVAVAAQRGRPPPLSGVLPLPAASTGLLGPAALDLGLGLPAPGFPPQVAPDAPLALNLGQPAPTVGIFQTIAPAALPLLGQPAPTLKNVVNFAALDLGLAMPTPTIGLVAPPTAGVPSVRYAVEILNSGATFGPNVALGEVWDARNIGWSRFDRMPGKAFFTLGQRSALLPLIVPLTTHFRILRITLTATTVVWAGVVADTNSTGDDVIVYGYDYLSLLSVSRAGYKTLYPTKLIGTEIVSPEWVLAKGAVSSPLGFVTTGTIENPLGTDGVTPIKTNAQFGTLDQMRLQLFFDLSEMGRANTTNYVTYEITKDSPNTFNFWKNKGSTWAGAFVLNGNVREYNYLPNWIAYRNDFASVAMTASSGPAEIVKKDDPAAASKGRRQDVFTARTLLGLSGAATEADQQQAALAQQLKRGLQLQPAIQLELLRGAYVPGVIGLCDRVPMEIVNGVDNVTGNWVFLGETCIVDESGELSNVLVRPLAT